MQNQAEPNQITPRPQSKPIPLYFDEKGKPQKEQDTEEDTGSEEHDHGKSHSGL